MAGSIYQTIFGGSLVAPANPTYLALNIAANVVLGWPLESNITSPATAEIIDVTATAAGLTIQLSDARQVGTGYCALFNNVGPNAVTVLDAAGNTLMAPAPGAAWQLYLADNTTLAGTWRAFQYGASVSVANAAALAGAGLKAVAATLNERIVINPQAANYAIQAGDRASCVEWVGGSGGTFMAPSPGAVGADWFCYIKNSGTGVLSLTPTSGTIDGTSSKSFNPNDSAILVSDGTNSFTMGYGQAVASSFNFVTISLAGDSGNVTLSGAQLNRISYKFTGALAGNTVVIVPASIQQYWVDNETTGAFTLTISAGGAGATFTIPQATRAILYCDGLNIVNAITSGGIQFADGSAGGPSITFASDTTLGFYKAGTDTLGISTAGIQRGVIGSAGNWTINAPSSGAALTITGVSGASPLVVNAAGSTPAISVLGAAATQLDVLSFTQSGQSTWIVYQPASSSDFRINGNGADRLVISSVGNVAIPAAGSGTTLTVTGSGANATTLIVVSSQGAAGGAPDIQVTRAGSTVNVVGEGPNIELFDSTNTTGTTLQNSGGQTELWQYNGGWAQVLKVNTTRGIVINAPSTGIALSIFGPGSGGAFAATVAAVNTAGISNGLRVFGGTNSSDFAFTVTNAASTVNWFEVRGDGVVLGNDGTNLFELGYKSIPPNNQAGSYALVASDRSKMVYYAGSGGATYTVPNGVFSQGDAILIVNFTASLALTIAQGSGMTLYWGGNGVTTGNRTLTGVGVATVTFASSAVGIVTGAGLS